MKHFREELDRDREREQERRREKMGENAREREREMLSCCFAFLPNSNLFTFSFSPTDATSLLLMFCLTFCSLLVFGGQSKCFFSLQRNNGEKPWNAIHSLFLFHSPYFSSLRPLAIEKFYSRIWRLSTSPDYSTNVTLWKRLKKRSVSRSNGGFLPKPKHDSRINSNSKCSFVKRVFPDIFSYKAFAFLNFNLLCQLSSAFRKCLLYFSLITLSGDDFHMEKLLSSLLHPSEYWCQRRRERLGHCAFAAGERERKRERGFQALFSECANNKSGGKIITAGREAWVY